MIECRDIHLSKGKNELIKGISWSFARGEGTAIIGPNGAGKSTLLKILLGIESPDSGEVLFQSKPLNSWHIRDLANLRAYMAQSSIARPGLPVFEYLSLARNYKAESIKMRDTYVNRVIGILALAPLAHKSIDRLSGGEFQRVELARAWCQLLDENGIEDKLLILDEPSSALDINQTQRLYQNLKQFLADGGTYVVVEHDINLAARFCDQIVMLSDGQQIAGGYVQNTFVSDNINRTFNVQGHTLVDPVSSLVSFNL